MIKIKDNLINENKIIQMCINEDNNLEIDVDNGFPRVIKNATFDDIEWNYDKNNNIHEEYVIAQLKEYENKIKGLEESLADEKRFSEALFNSRVKLTNRIHEAIKYIEEHQPVFEITSKKDLQDFFENNYYNTLLKILKKGSEENEER